MDRNTVIKALECRKNAGKRCCNPCEETGNCHYAIAFHSFDGGVYLPYICDKERICTDAIELLKEQEAVKPVLDEKTGRIWLCGNCGSYVGFDDNDPHDLNEFDKISKEVFGDYHYCRECGRPVLWKGR